MTTDLLRRAGVLASTAFLLANCASMDAAVVGPAVEADGADGRFARLSETLDAYVDDGRLPGGVIRVTQDDEIVFADAFGWRDVDDEEPMTQDTLFRIASQTKAIVSVAALILQEDGALLLDDPISKYLPEWADAKVSVANAAGGFDLVPVERPITVHDLLIHASGVGYGSRGDFDSEAARKAWAEAGIESWYLSDKKEPIRDLVARMAELPMNAQPGERWLYGYNTDILGAVVEVAAGMPLDEFLQSRMFDPLGMDDTHFYLPTEKADRLATVYSSTEEKGLVEAPDPGDGVGQGAYVEGPRTTFSGGAGLVSTARDYGRFLQMLENDGALDGARVLSRKSVELMTSDNLPSGVEFRPGVGFGLGVSVVTDLGLAGRLGSVGEYGWGGAYHSSYWVDPSEELTVVYFTQVIPAGDLDDFGYVRALIYSALE